MSEHGTLHRYKKGCRCGACKEHKRVTQHVWYEKHKKQHIANVSARKARNREWFREYKKTLKCEECGESHVACLDFHHTDPAEKDFDVTFLANAGYGPKRVLAEVVKCKVLCANCHRKLHYELLVGSPNGMAPDS